MAEQIVIRIVLMCVSAATICAAGLVHPAPASVYLASGFGLSLGYGFSFASLLWRRR